MTRLRQIRAGVLALGCALAAPAAQAQDVVVPISYDDLAATSAGRVTFDALPRRAEPGLNFDAPMRLGALWLAERFAGQTVAAHGPFDSVGGAPLGPLALRPGPSGTNQSVAHHRGFGSNALFPLGPRGFPDLAARGEGAVALLFDEDQAEIGLRVHSDYPDPLGQRPARRGRVTLVLYTRQGHEIARHVTPLGPGVTEIALRRTRGLRDIAGVLILNDDPGGIAIDDILYQIAPKLG
ncbi:hypothetical protein [Roseovarius aestuariivivens]|uniref:hypothetical protein n=1 Tax=Roseovarius aestuariivivens TaxID=1888910 RepID=UPI0010821A56|nr:hypothetical protein [Roseovarius aestuariivivens]